MAETGPPLLGGSFQELTSLTELFLLFLFTHFFPHTSLLSFLPVHLSHACSSHTPARHCVSAATFSNSTACLPSPPPFQTSDVSQDTAARTETPGAAPFALPFLPATTRTQLFHSPGKGLTEYSAVSNHPYSSCSLHCGELTIFVRFTPCNLKC